MYQVVINAKALLSNGFDDYVFRLDSAPHFLADGDGYTGLVTVTTNVPDQIELPAGCSVVSCVGKPD